MYQEPLINAWTRRGKKYKSKTFDALRQLYSKEANDEKGHSDRGSGTNDSGDVVKEAGDPVLRNS